MRSTNMRKLAEDEKGKKHDQFLPYRSGYISSVSEKDYRFILNYKLPYFHNKSVCILKLINNKFKF